jgi:REP element-mobilizing transposase RayT
MYYPLHYPHFFTATILEWKQLLKPDKFKEIIINSLRFLVQENKVQIFAFVIMTNHIHLIWRMQNDADKTKVQQSFMKFTAQKILQELRNNHPQVLLHFKVDAKDRKYQIWKRNALSIEIHSNEVMQQKMNYIHENPVKAGIVENAVQYKYSTALHYKSGEPVWDFVTKWGA